MLRLGAGELMPLILNEDDVHALRPAASPCSGWVRDSTNSPPWARCEAPGRARRPPRPPSPPQDIPLGSRAGRSAKATPVGSPPRRDLSSAGRGERWLRMSPRTAEASETWHFHALLWGRLFHPHLGEDGVSHGDSPLAMSVSPALRRGGRGTAPTRVLPRGTPGPSLGRRSPLRRGLRGARSGAAARAGAGSGRGNRNVTSPQTN